LNELDVPFCGGALGYWGYDLARHWIKLPGNHKELATEPDMAVGIYDWAVVIDHRKQTARLVSQLRNPETEKKLPLILERLVKSETKSEAQFSVSGKINTKQTREEYGTSFQKIRDYLIEGDCYQVNLAHSFSAAAEGDALQAYLALREISPAPYAAFLNISDVQILSVSPEKFLKLNNRLVETKPIKGTRQRSEDIVQDDKLKEDLCSNEKDRAENLMIVDLLRNDLSKNCVAGSVVVNKLFALESYANVHHLVSTITGELRADQDALTLLKDCFPGGSITGAPKKRAMEIIEQLEPQRRGLYCGSIGYIGWDGNMDTNIAIRTLIYSAGKIQFSVGGGIVADSNEAGEYQETLDKAAGMIKMLTQFGGIFSGE
jgi:para-aminobenzoate synthetase component 1